MALAIALLMLLVFAPSAAAQDDIQTAAEALRRDPVYVAPGAELAGQVDADALREQIRSSGASPMYVAVLPGDAAASPEEALNALHDAVGLQGTYAVVAGRRFRAGSSLFRVAGEASAAAQSHDDIQGALEDFIGRVGDLRAGRQPSGSGGGGGSGSFGIVLLVLLLGVGGVFVMSRRRRRREQVDELAEVKENTRDDLVALGEDIRALDLDVQMPNADPAAKEDYARAVDAYDRANRAFESARVAEDLQPAAEALEEGRWAMTSAKARLEGRRPPERRAPCFFDPRHGPSSREVEWAPPAGTPRPVPACEADAQRVERGEDPHARELVVGGRSVPYWDAGPAYAPFYGGFFGGFGGVPPGMGPGAGSGGGGGGGGGGG